MDRSTLAAARMRAYSRRDEEYEDFLSQISVDAPKNLHKHPEYAKYFKQEHCPGRYGVKEVDGDLRLVTTVFGLSDYEFESEADALTYITERRAKLSAEKAERLSGIRSEPWMQTRHSYPYAALAA